MINPENELIYCVECQKNQCRYIDGICANCFNKKSKDEQEKLRQKIIEYYGLTKNLGNNNE